MKAKLDVLTNNYQLQMEEQRKDLELKISEVQDLQ